ncbi:MAG: SLAC1 anion channel family protein [Phaeovulum sp.]|uniref:SLAC1 anion channel family protein n=1 Tax=Phaeovulum sp. TaxID=2934796 RepID=UPI002730FFC3|nr:SLAC1 anion channel family protein [Phaeovulum sp.]MDP2062305.1 SLAC1 anion channel family protein [Phaeovulum sp.]
MPPTAADSAAAPSGLEHYPITLFATTMGLGGFTLALRAGAESLGLGGWPWQAALALTVAVFVLVAAGYALKALRHPAAVVAEWRHPVRLAFFPTVSISLLIIATAALPLYPAAAEAAWLFGTGLQAVLALAVITGWISARAFQQGHLNPAWFIPAVGNVIVPVAGAQMGYVETSFLFFSAGMIFWMVLLTLVFNRLVFHDPMPARLQPTLVIMIAPPAVASIAWLRMTGEMDAFGHILMSLGFVFAALVAVQVPRILRLPFALSFWALSFPVAALTIASLLHHEATGTGGYLWLGAALLAVLSLLIAGLVGRTLLAMVRGEICKPE